MRNEDILNELEYQATWMCKIQKIDILWFKDPFLATAVILCITLFTGRLDSPIICCLQWSWRDCTIFSGKWGKREYCWKGNIVIIIILCTTCKRYRWNWRICNETKYAFKFWNLWFAEKILPWNYHLSCNVMRLLFVGLLLHPFWLKLYLALFGHHFSTFKLPCFARDHWWGFITRNAHLVHIVN